MKAYYYIGLDVHKKTVSFCSKTASGRIIAEGVLPAKRETLKAWARSLKKGWIGGLEATMFSGWIYDVLKPYSQALYVGHPLRMKAITSAKKKSDGIDAATLADLLRSNLFPACYMAPEKIRELRRILRYRQLMVYQGTRMKNKTAGLLMEVGAEYTKKKLHGEKYFGLLLERLDGEIPDSVKDLLRLSRGQVELYGSIQKRLQKGLMQYPMLQERVQRLMSIQGIGEVTALTWALEIGECERFRSIKQVVSYVGLCSAYEESAGKVKRGPLSKQRNWHLQMALIEAAKLAPRWNRNLQVVYQRELQRSSNRNRATIMVARKLAAYLLAVDRGGQPFEERIAA
jgi:transposase